MPEKKPEVEMLMRVLKDRGFVKNKETEMLWRDLVQDLPVEDLLELYSS